MEGRQGRQKQALVGKEQTMRLLDQDLPRTFPQYAFFHAHEGGDDNLRIVLETFVCYRPDVGYVQGMSYLASMLLLFVHDPFDCFTCFANLLSHHFFYDFYSLRREPVCTDRPRAGHPRCACLCDVCVFRSSCT